MGINTAYIDSYKNDIIGLINSVLVPILIAAAFIVFLYGIYKYFIKGAAIDKERETGRIFALYGVIGFVIIFSLWAFVNILMGTLRLGGQFAPNPPTIGTGASAPIRQQGTYNTLPDSSYGCTDSSASNYSPNATVNDGSCRYASNAGTNPSSTAATSCDYGVVDGTACRTGSGQSGVCVNGTCRVDTTDIDGDANANNTSQANTPGAAPVNFTVGTVPVGGACSIGYQCVNGSDCIGGTCQTGVLPI